MDISELKNCPKCDGDPAYDHVVIIDVKPFVRCERSCSFGEKIYFTPEEWNALPRNYENDSLFQEVTNEITRATRLHPNWPKNIYEQLAIVGEEFGELQKAVLDHKHKGASFSDIKTEAIQTAAMAMRFLINLKEV